MFAPADIREITRLYPPNELLESDPLNGLPPLLLSLSGNDLLTRNHILREFEQLVRSVTHRISVSSVSQNLDVDENIIQKVVRGSPHLALFSADERHIITKNKRDALWKKIRETASGRIVKLDIFAQEESISTQSADILVLSDLDDSEWPDDIIFEFDKVQSRYVTSLAYAENLKGKLRNSLEESRMSVKPLTIFPHDLFGSPPSWYIMRIIKALLNDTTKPSDWKLNEEPDKVECIPIEFTLQRRDEETARLAEGSISCIDLRLFAEKYSDLYPTVKDVENYFSGNSTSARLSIISHTAISDKWLDNFIEKSLQAMHQVGFVDVTTDIANNFPAPIQKDILSRVKQLLSLHQSADVSQIHLVDRYVLSHNYYQSFRAAAHSEAREQAKIQWDAMKENPETDLRSQVSSEDTCQTLHGKDQKVITIHQEMWKIFAKETEKEYWDEISDLELKNEEDVSKFWTDRVESRAIIYTEGLKAVEDAKLQSQLSELLCSYLLKDLIPDSLARARSQGLTRSRKTRKNVKKLESILSQGPIALSNLLSATKKFGKKQGIPELEETAISESMTAQVNDMVRKMHKQANGPLLFLTLIIVLLARQQQKLVYATGKFAPKLMKQLKASMKPEDYEQLEKWKDLAKAGTLTAEDKEQMRAVADGE